MQKPTKVNPDLQEERDKVQFNVEEFTNWYYGGKENVQQKRFLGKHLIQYAIVEFDKLFH